MSNEDKEKPTGRPTEPPAGDAGAKSTSESTNRPENPFQPRPGVSKKKSKRGSASRGNKQSPDQKQPDQKAAASAAEPSPSGKRTAESEPSFITKVNPKKYFDRRNVTALTVAGIAVVAIAAVIISYTIWAMGRDPEGTATQPVTMSAEPGPVLTPASMITEEWAKAIDPERSWEQTLDQSGVNDSSPGAACVTPQPTDQPTSQITLLRGLASPGNDRMAALHRADSYATNEEASQVFDFRSTELGGCTDTPLYIENGFDVTGVGDQALGVRLVLQDQQPEYHTVVLVRTGRVVDVIDVARFGQPADMEGVVEAMTPVVNTQCGPAVGLCTSPNASVAKSIPPPGGDQPGFLAAGDIPRVTLGVGTWKGNALATRIDVQDGSSCEAVDFATVSGPTTRQQRTYLLRNDPAAPPQFGIDQVVLKMDDAAGATELVDRISNNIRTCGERTLTSKVDKAAPLATPGAGGVPVRGNWFVVTQKVDETRTQIYRVGIMSAGDKVIYLRSNPTADFNFSDDSWIGVNLRAGERATQVR